MITFLVVLWAVVGALFFGWLCAGIEDVERLKWWKIAMVSVACGPLIWCVPLWLCARNVAVGIRLWIEN